MHGLRYKTKNACFQSAGRSGLKVVSSLAAIDGQQQDGILGIARQVLVVEDLPRIQELIREVVEAPGQLEVTGFVTTAQDAIDVCLATSPDALIVDLHLAQGSGIDVIKAVRRQCEPHLQPIILVLTNHATPQLEKACRRVGANYFLDKSKDFAQVRTILLEAFASSSSASNS